MSVIIKGVKIPKCCRKCPIPYNIDVVWQYCGTLGASFMNEDSIFDNNPTYKHPNCPLVELPKKHGRLIDEDEYCVSQGCYKENDDCNCTICDCKTILEREE